MSRYALPAALLFSEMIATSNALDISSLRPGFRRLSFEQIGGYSPGSSVTDHNAIDLDQAAMESQLALRSDQSFENARGVYTEGGHSKSFAEVTLSAGLPVAVSKGTRITGVSSDGTSEVVGKAYKDTPAGSTVLLVQYATTDIQSSYMNCQVGALSNFGEENTVGCFASQGQLSVDGGGLFSTLDYTYDPQTDNNNGRNIQGFSTDAEAKMYTCDNGCPHAEYSKYYEYYGEFDYADKWVTAAFNGERTSMQNGADFSKYGYIGREEAIKKGTAYMNVYMYVIREFEDALGDCSVGCINCNDDPVHAWDEGVAFYTGSLVGQQGEGSGKLLYTLADKRCVNYKTCGPGGNSVEGTSKVNYDLSSEFAVGNFNLVRGNCNAVRPTVDRIVDLMAVPLIQGTIRYAYKVDKEQDGEKGQAEGAVFAAAVLPRLAACNAGDAEIVYDNMKVGASSTSYEAVKQAFERNYGCMNISCSDVGGLWSDATNGYYPGASPCDDSSLVDASLRTASASASSNNTGAIVGGIVAGIVAVVALIGVGFMVHREKSGNPVFVQTKEMS